MTTSSSPRIAVLYATAQGSTRDIAEFICDNLVARGATAELHDIAHAPDLSTIDTVVIGSAIHDMDLLPEATAYLRHNLNTLAGKDVWLFSVGLGPALRGPLGRWAGRQVPRKIAAVLGMLHPHDYIPFAGRYEREGVSWRARTMYRVLGGARYGDLRDWQAVREWSTRIGDALALPHAPASVVQP
ncbi:flavodoxin domain-containing protein [Nocardia mangyaensis]|uniref:flavodoxin domain-containing protein n=1 Tax=Nocardia mangyaensis TaxID=2213200 RepID=UPI002676A90A|nr:flavodoxin domain-containing protein [Nocardia mangyaensis]MDO3647705.1 flavodoxin domain-containing protein [Nocardia mangyaensis]